MKKILSKTIFIFIFCIFYVTSFAQTNTSNELVSQKLTYHPELSSPDTYDIVENLKNKVVTEDILLEMNKHRRHDEPVNWVIEKGFIIKLFPFKN